jgi:hypothetical protein
MPTDTVAEKSPATVSRSFTLRCCVYPERSTGLFVAECIDLNLIVKAKKDSRAMRELRDAVLGYVRVAVESGHESDLIPRPSPLMHRVHYHLLFAASLISPMGRSRTFDCTPTVEPNCFA